MALGGPTHIATLSQIYEYIDSAFAFLAHLKIICFMWTRGECIPLSFLNINQNVNVWDLV